MSKHVWRGTRDAIVVHPGLSRTNCTVVEDAACFPVREAMRYIRDLEHIYKHVPQNIERDARFAARGTYLEAVSRMKARKGKR